MRVSEHLRIRWSVVAWCAGPVILVALMVGAGSAAVPWMSMFPPEAGRNLTEGFLRFLVVGYVAALTFLPASLALLGWLLTRARTRNEHRPALARAALLCGSMMIALVMVELASFLWLARMHRMPTLPARFADDARDRNELSLAVIGGSTALGYPYDPQLSIGQILGWQLGKALPQRRVSVNILAKMGKNLEEMHRELAGLKRRPDAILIYSGHNEFLSRFDASSQAGLSEAPHNPFLQRLYQVTLRSPFCRLSYETINKFRLGGPPPLINTHELTDPPLFTPSQYSSILEDFRRRLETIVDYCERIGALAILVIPAANETGYEPNRSVLAPPVTPDQRNAVTARFHEARAHETSDPARSIAEYKDLLAERPEFAEAHFRLARLLERSGAFKEALGHFVKARDLDGFPVRCNTDFAQVYRDVAARHQCILVDGPETLRRASRHGIVNDELVHDAHHPTFRGYLALSQAVLDRLHETKAFGLSSGQDQRQVIDPAECADHFKVDSGVWAMACVRSGTYYSHLSSARYDATERRAKKIRFLSAANEIRAGLPPEQSGIPGVGLGVPVSLRWDWWNADTPSTHAARDAGPGSGFTPKIEGIP